MQERKEIHGRKGRGVKWNTLEEEPGASILKRILEEEVRDKIFEKYGKVKVVQEKKEVRKCRARHNQKNNRWLGNRRESKSSSGMKDSWPQGGHSGVHPLGTLSRSLFEWVRLTDRTFLTFIIFSLSMASTWKLKLFFFFIITTRICIKKTGRN